MALLRRRWANANVVLQKRSHIPPTARRRWRLEPGHGRGVDGADAAHESAQPQASGGQRMSRMSSGGVLIHTMAVVHDDCEIGEGTKIWQFASVLRGAVLGRDCIVASGACFDGSVAGDRTILCHNLAAGPGFRLGDDVFIAPNVTLANDA